MKPFTFYQTVNIYEKIIGKYSMHFCFISKLFTGGSYYSTTQSRFEYFITEGIQFRYEINFRHGTYDLLYVTNTKQDLGT